MSGTKVRCGGCSASYSPSELYDHFVASHANFFDHLKEEASAIVSPMNGADPSLCSVVSGGSRCQKAALVIPQLYLGLFDRRASISAPVVTHLSITLGQQLCGEHALEITPQDLLNDDLIGLIEEQCGAARQYEAGSKIIVPTPGGLRPDWSKAGLAFKPFFAPPQAS